MADERDQPQPLIIEVPDGPHRPRRPWFKDERVFGDHGPTNARTARFLILAVMAALVVLAFGTIFCINLLSDTRQELALGHEHRLQDERVIQQEIAQLHRQEVADKAANRREDASTRDLACWVVDYVNRSGAPQTRQGRKFVHILSHRYRCRGYVPEKHPVPPTHPQHRSHSPSPLPGQAIGPGPQPDPSSSTPAMAEGGPSFRPTRSPATHQASTTPSQSAQPSPTPRPSSTPRPTPTPPSSSSPRPRPTPTLATHLIPSPVSSLLCSVTDPLIGTCIVP